MVTRMHLAHVLQVQWNRKNKAVDDNKSIHTEKKQCCKNNNHFAISIWRTHKMVKISNKAFNRQRFLCVSMSIINTAYCSVSSIIKCIHNWMCMALCTMCCGWWHPAQRKQIELTIEINESIAKHIIGILISSPFDTMTEREIETNLVNWLKYQTKRNIGCNDTRKPSHVFRRILLLLFLSLSALQNTRFLIRWLVGRV